MPDPLFETFSLYPLPRLLELGLPSDQATFLSEIGLPTWCAPNMHFGEVFKLGEYLPLIDRESKRHVGLGEDRDDNVISFDLKEHVVWSLPQSSPARFVAPSVVTLAETLIMFQACVNSAVDVDSQSFVENRIPPEYFGPFIQQARALAPAMLSKGSFWSATLLWLGVPNHSFEADGSAAAQLQR